MVRFIALLITVLFSSALPAWGGDDDRRSEAIRALKEEIDARLAATGTPKPIVLTANSPRTQKDYWEASQNKVLSASRTVEQPDETKPSGSIVVAIVVGRDGSLIRTNIYKLAGNDQLARLVKESVVRAAPFDPLPESIPQASEQIVLISTFSVEGAGLSFTGDAPSINNQAQSTGHAGATSINVKLDEGGRAAASIATDVIGTDHVQPTWPEKIVASIKSNWIRPSIEESGTSSCTSIIEIDRSGEVMSVRFDPPCVPSRLQSSIEAAIIKSSPFPLPAKPSEFSQKIVARFVPRDEP